MAAATDSTWKPDILVVDDTPANLNVLSEMLREHGYRARPVPSGALAIKAAEARPPDLVLLDVNMPDMDGYEVCEKLKQSDTLQDIPIIFISALNETVDKIKAFSAGGQDYITKPFQFEEVAARVNTHLKLRWQQLELEENYQKLRDLEVLRDNLTHMIIHDMRSPLMAVMGAFDIIAADENLPTGDIEMVRMGQHASKELSDMANAMLDISRMEAGEMPLELEPVDAHHIVEAATELLAGSTTQALLQIIPPPSPVKVTCDEEIVRRVITNLAGNALKFTPAGGTVTVAAKGAGDRVVFEVSDTGHGIPKAYHSKIFEKFGQVEARSKQERHSSGLGLTFCKLAAEAHMGEISLESETGRGSTFRVTLPAAGPTRATEKEGSTL